MRQTIVTHPIIVRRVSAAQGRVKGEPNSSLSSSPDGALSLGSINALVFGQEDGVNLLLPPWCDGGLGRCLSSVGHSGDVDV